MRKLQLLGSVAAGLVESKRRKEQDDDLRDYRKSARDYYGSQADYYRSQAERARRSPANDTFQPDASYRDSDAGRQVRMMGVEEEDMARGGMVGHGDSEISDWNCAGGSSDLWQKQSFKK